MMIPVLPIVGLVGASNFKHCDHHSRNCGCSDFVKRIRKYVRFSIDGKYRRRIYDGFSGDGKLSIGTPGNLETSEQYEKGIRRCRTICNRQRIPIRKGIRQQCTKLGFLPEAQNDMIFLLSVKNWD